MRHYNVKPITVIFEPSYRLLVLLLAISLCAIGIVFTIPWPRWLQMAGSVLIASYALFCIRSHALLLTPSACRRLEVNSQGELWLSNGQGTALQARVLGGSFVASYLTVLHLRLEHSRWTKYILVLPDGVDQGQFRQLRVWLRWGNAVAREGEGSNTPN